MSLFSNRKVRGVLSEGPAQDTGILSMTPSGNPLDSYMPSQELPPLPTQSPQQRLMRPQPGVSPMAAAMDEQPLPGPREGIGALSPVERPDGPTDLGSPVLPPRDPRYKPFSKENRSESLLALGTGLLSHPESFAAGIGAAGENLGDLRRRYEAPSKTTLGGPDNAFNISTDPRTGEQTVTPNLQVQSYAREKAAAAKAPAAPNATDNVQFRASTAAAIAKLPPEQRPVAWAIARQDGKALGFNLNIPKEFVNSALDFYKGQGVSVGDAAKAEATAAAAAQAQANSDRNFNHKERVFGLSERKFNRGPAPKAATAPKLSTRFTLDN